MNEEKNITGLNELFSGEAGSRSVYFLGIGGIGMSALARYFISRKIKVSGYDKTPTALTEQLQQEGITIHFEDDVSQLDKGAHLVVYTPAIPEGHQEMEYYRQHDYLLLKRSDVLGWITKGTFNISVAGTHGKTTTSAMIAHMLRDSGYGSNAFLGGIATNYGTNFWSNERQVSVSEADEYDRSFLKLSPDIALVTSMDADHLDIYGTEEKMQDAFIAFTGKIKKGGLLVVKEGLQRQDEMRADQKITYGLTGKPGAKPGNIKIVDGSYVFDVTVNDQTIENIQLKMGGRHNIENAVACITVGKFLEIDEARIRKALGNFAGVKRRFEYVLKTAAHIVIDDYAHHPEELKALINGARELYPGRKCTVVFQPHLFSRTRDLAAGFGEALSLADEVLVLPIYPAREEPIAGVSSEIIIEKVEAMKKMVISKEGLLKEIEKNKPELLVMAGAGDIDAMVETVKNILSY